MEQIEKRKSKKIEGTWVGFLEEDLEHQFKNSNAPLVVPNSQVKFAW